MKVNTTNLIPAIVALIVFGVIVILVWDYPPAASRLILVMGFLGIVLSSILVLSESGFWRKQGRPEEGMRVEGSRYTMPANKVLPITVWIVGIAPLVYLVGFTPGLSLYALTYYKLHGGRWSSSIMLGLLMAAVIYFGFVLGLGVIFPKPILLPFLRW